MNFESLLPSLESLWDVSFLIFIVGVVLFYFGKLICGSKFLEYEKSDYYIHGLGFFVNYLIVPFLVVLAFFEVVNWYFSIWFFPIWLSLLASLFMTGVLSAGVMFNIIKFRLFTRFEPSFEEKVSESKGVKRIQAVDKRFGTTVSQDIPEMTRRYYDGLKSMADFTTRKLVLFVFSTLIIWISISTYHLEPYGLYSIIIYVLVFFNYTFIAVQFGYSGLIKPLVKVVLDNGSELSGRLLKMGKNVVIAQEDKEKTITVNSSKIIYIEGNMIMDKNNFSKRLE